MGYGLCGIGARLRRRADSWHDRALAVYRRIDILRVRCMERSGRDNVGKRRLINGGHRTRVCAGNGYTDLGVDVVYHRRAKNITGAE